uniref:Uncharacterized protein n=1 Tax=Corethron hystrix TaxID=216773 RepID=A0A7S1BP14_9STRA
MKCIKIDIKRTRGKDIKQTSAQDETARDGTRRKETKRDDTGADDEPIAAKSTSSATHLGHPHAEIPHGIDERLHLHGIRRHHGLLRGNRGGRGAPLLGTDEEGNGRRRQDGSRRREERTPRQTPPTSDRRCFDRTAVVTNFFLARSGVWRKSCRGCVREQR